jgi:hypothetical protein
LAAAVACAALSLAPPTTSAKPSCIFDDLRASDRNRDRVERSLFCLTNLHRVRSGVSPVTVDTRLMTAARNHSIDMIARLFYDHLNPEGLDPTERARAAGYPFGTGESIAANLGGRAENLFDQWLNSPPHNQNMLTPHYRAAGMGIEARCCPVGGTAPGVTGTQMFGVGAANTSDDALDFYASSNRCAKAKERDLLKRKARKRAGGAKRRRLSDQIRDLKKDVGKRCEELR